MRSDMHKVIVERPRRGTWNVGAKVRPTPLALVPTRAVGWKVTEGQRHKSLNENLAPLVRYLRSQVSRPWNKVYSEISQHLRADSTVQQHVRDHLTDYVAVNGLNAPRDRWHRLPKFYVDRRGILKETARHPEVLQEARRKKASAAPAPKLVRVSPALELRLINGCWFAFDMKPLPEPKFASDHSLCTPPVVDCEGNNTLAGPPYDRAADWRTFRRLNPHRAYAAAKRSLSRDELRRHGLANDSD